MTAKQTTGQKLVAFTNMSNSADGSQVHVHSADCKDLSKPRYRHADKVDEGTVWESKSAFGLDYWSDINNETPDQPPYIWDDIKFFPCVALPDYSADQADSDDFQEIASRDSVEVKDTGRKYGPNDLRREARGILWTALQNQISQTADGELKDMMNAQAARVAKMFDL